MVLFILFAFGFMYAYHEMKKTPEDASYLKKFNGKQYSNADCDGKIDSLLDALGVSEDAKLATKSPNTVIVLEHLDGQKYSIKQTLDDRTETFTFEEGKELLYDSPDGRKLKVMVLQTWNVLTEFDKWKDSRGRSRRSQVTRVFTDEELTTTITVDHITSICKYQIVK